LTLPAGLKRAFWEFDFHQFGRIKVKEKSPYTGIPKLHKKLHVFLDLPVMALFT
jgi:hypothetical protein